VSNRYEREIEEILRRQQASDVGRREPTPARGGGSGWEMPAWFNRVFRTTAERLIGLALVLGVASYLARLLPPSPAPMVLAVLAAVLILVAVAGAPAGLGRPRPTQFWRDRPIDIGSSGDFSRRLGYSWWRLRVAVRRLFGR